MHSRNKDELNAVGNQNYKLESSNRCEIMLNYTDEKGKVAIEGYKIIIEDCC